MSPAIVSDSESPNPKPDPVIWLNPNPDFNEKKFEKSSQLEFFLYSKKPYFFLNPLKESSGFRRSLHPCGELFKHSFFLLGHHLACLDPDPLVILSQIQCGPDAIRSGTVSESETL
jgi:hypothetical protein